MGFRTFNPSLNSWNSEVYEATSELELASKLSELASCQSEFSRSSPIDRARFLRFIAEQLSSQKSVIQEMYCKESGLSPERFSAEWTRTMHTLELFAHYLEKEYTFEKVQELANESISIRKKRLAIGPVLVMGSSNFPLAYSTIGGDSVAAFAAGCCVLVKAHPMHVGTSMLVAKCIEIALARTEFPQGIFAHIIDDGVNLAQQIVADNRIQAVGFTGSIRGGKAIMEIAQNRPSPIPVFAEMGSCNPMIIFPGLNPDDNKVIAQKIGQAICNDAGQFCTKPGLLFVPSGMEGDNFLHALKEALLTKSPVPMLHPRIFENYERRKKEVSSVPQMEVFTCPTHTQGIEGAWTLAETNLEVFQSNVLLHEEVFGPFSLVIRYDSQDKLKHVLNGLPGQLTASLIYSVKTTEVESFIALLCNKAGRIILNGVPTGVRVLEVMHHGGPFPASSDSRFTAVGPDSITRFQKEVTIQEENIS
jgi:alpha-ketoglutaric semialdehyde dehydrogenase